MITTTENIYLRKCCSHECDNSYKTELALESDKCTAENSDITFKGVKKLKDFWNNIINNKSVIKSEQQSDILLLHNKRSSTLRTNRNSDTSACTNENELDEENIVIRKNSKVHSSPENFDKFKTADRVIEKRRTFDIEYVNRLPNIDQRFSVDGTNDNSISTIMGSNEFVNQNSAKDNFYKMQSSSDSNLLRDNTIEITADLNKTVSEYRIPPKSMHGSLSKRTGRKLSFKTYPTQSRKIILPNENQVSSLTQKFNQLIKKDDAILEKVKRNGGIVLKTDRHVYKILDTDEKLEAITSKASKRKGSVKNQSKESEKTVETNSSGENIVYATVKKFEKELSTQPTPALKKPKVPDKSSKVLCQKQELVKSNSFQNKLKLQSDTKETPTNYSIEIPAAIDSELSKQELVKSNSFQNKLKLQSDTKETPTNYSIEIPAAIDSGLSKQELVKSNSFQNKLKLQSDTKQIPTNCSIEIPAVIESGSCEEEVSSLSKNISTGVIIQSAELAGKKDEQEFDNTPVIKPSEKLYEKEKSPIKTSGSRLYDKIRYILRPTKKSRTLSGSTTPEQKLVDALETVNQRIETLSRSENDLSAHNATELQPNVSFLFRRDTSQNSFGSVNDVNETHKVTEAVNTGLINKTQSMDETRFPSSSEFSATTFLDDMLYESHKIVSLNIENDAQMILNQSEELIKKLKQDYVENDYEVISLKVPENNDKTSMNEPSKIDTNIYETPIKNITNCSHATESEIYQSIDEIKTAAYYHTDDRNKTDDINSESSYESYDSNYEVVVDSPNTKPENGYDEIKNTPPEPPPPRPNNKPIIQHCDISLPPESSGHKRNNYEQIKYDTARPSLEKKLPPPLPQPAVMLRHDHSIEMLQWPKVSSTSIDTLLTPTSPSESLSNRNELFRMMTWDCSDTISTLSSDHKTNSLYGTMDQNTRSPSNNSTEGSDEWTDISDGETDDKNRFIVVRHRVKSRDSPSIIKKPHTCKVELDLEDEISEVSISTPSVMYLMNKNEQLDYATTYPQLSEPVYENTITLRAQQQSQLKFNNILNLTNTSLRGIEPDKLTDKINKENHFESQFVAMYIDGSEDHHYESLSTVGQSSIDKKTSATATESSCDNYTSLQSSHPTLDIAPEPMNPITPLKNRIRDGALPEEEFDSFESDGETDEEVNIKTDSGVDMSNTKQLPEPPPSQVYALMQITKHFLNFTEISKSLVRIGKKKPSSSTKNSPNQPPDIPPITDENRNRKSSEYERPKLNPRQKSVKKLSLSKSPEPTTYENVEFHSPPVYERNMISSPVLPASNLNSCSNLKLDLLNEKNNSSSELTRKKSKGSKSFKSKIKNGFGASDSNPNIGTSFSGTRSTFYTSDSVDVDSGIFSGSNDTIQNSDNKVSAEERIPIIHPELPPVVPPPRRKHKVNRSPESNRRKTTIGIRPNNPPPPPPPLSAKQKRYGNTSWYAECGVFKTVEGIENRDDGSKVDRKSRTSTTSWYTDSGLYQAMSGVSVASSSGSSGVSTGGEGGPGDDSSHFLFSNEPLYQIYNAAKIESISRDIMEHNANLDGYEEISHKQLEDEPKKSLRPSALQLVEPKQGPSRTLWCEIPEVINSGLLTNLSVSERQLQEAKFEILTSEASYLKSLNLLRTHFMNHPAFRDVKILSPNSRKGLFSSITPVFECSDRLLSDLEMRWQENVMLCNLSDSIAKNAEKYFKVYISYCENQGRLDRTLKHLKENNKEFRQKLEVLELHPACCGLSLHSFLMLPMQRITRMPLLIDAVLQKTKTTDVEYESWKTTLTILNTIVHQCNEAAKYCAQTYELEQISRLIEFPTYIAPIPIVPVGPGVRPRILVRKGQLTLWKNEDSKQTFGKRLPKLQKDMATINAFLFTDLLVLTKKKTDGKYQVTDYCQRSMLEISSGDVIATNVIRDPILNGKFWMLLTMLENHERKTVEMVVSCSTETERVRWLQATAPPSSENPHETLYAQWDCPQVMANHAYISIQPDEISLEVGDVVNVTVKTTEGWYYGERLRDGICGWFPANHSQEVASPHVRARNLKQRHRLLVFSANYLESMKKNRFA